MKEHLDLCVKSVCLFVCRLWDFFKKINSGVFFLFVCFGFVFILPCSSGGQKSKADMYTPVS